MNTSIVIEDSIENTLKLALQKEFSKIGLNVVIDEDNANLVFKCRIKKFWVQEFQSRLWPPESTKADLEFDVALIDKVHKKIIWYDTKKSYSRINSCIDVTRHDERVINEAFNKIITSIISDYKLIESIYSCIKKNKLQKDEMPLLVDGIEKIKNQQLRITVSQFLYYQEQLDYLNIYDFMSSIYLSKYLPDISNAVGYKLNMERTSEISMTKYLNILDVKQESDTQFNLEVVLKTSSEGLLMTIRETYFFILENGEWKCNGFDIKDYLEIIDM